ncbi:16S rRNA (guanine(527)-N(7))-methyltransferase RsmG [Halanaerobium congolense]|jgi:16S rRNA (guanine527-N7)-methyltransferase|uniref:Ribosomal RNA small subunit methyltransferase G n=1 Tax=Halanaerobium congolense TaxID=54121 RepID=A0A1G6IKG2_9FIRM|nr:16S rRNA (guanine(527)-N(7))-methyltransferase RsmG [Halanaerobium congolense]PXV64537.1 16S rRNA m(7)G-527 methyltransferase [Halanaerobium congolense]TDP12266.1 16S rRNA m(7)G-527 methyltransferase [Halanaerobium congolense]SDC07019.1 16S rRNA m(7)G-527 methyltransferase [Halanaerobium congolense]
MKINKEKFISQLEKGIKDLDISYSNEQLQQLWEYYLFFIEENKKYNLSTITEPEEVIKKHFLDSLVILNQLNIDQRKRWLDIGTGAGFPGMVLKLFLPGDSFYLLDSSSKKVNFLNQLIYKLGLSGIDATHGRAEDLAKISEWRGSFDFVCSRAVASLNVLLEYAVPFLKIGGLAYLYKGPEYKTEIEEAKNALDILGAKIKKTIELDVPGLEAERYLIIVEKNNSTEEKYPRRAGIPKKRPL